MKSFGLIAVLAAALMAAPVFAQEAPAAAGSMTVHCKDGTTQTVSTTKGACHGHKGIDKSASNTAASSMPAVAPAAAAKSKAMPEPAAAPAAGGGAGQVWVNTGSKTKTYHCQGSKWYGKTKEGKYMSAADAQAAGYHAAKNEKCS
jgi:hypothetical protein